MRHAFVIFFLALALSMEAAENKDAELTRLSADLASAMTQADLNIASGKIAQYWDHRLTAIETKVVIKLGAKEAGEFAKSKALWLDYRAKEVSFRAGFFEGGSIQPLIANSHYSKITEHRVAELEAFWADALNN